MTNIFLQECSAQALRCIVAGMDNVEWQRFSGNLTGASSAQGVLTQNKWSLLDALLRGGELLEGSDFRRQAEGAQGPSRVTYGLLVVSYYKLLVTIDYLLGISSYCSSVISY